MELDMEMNPIERLRIETENAKDNRKAMGMLLLDAISKDESLAGKYRKTTLEKMEESVLDGIKKLATNGVYYCSDKEMLGMMIHILDEDLAIFDKRQVTVTLTEDEKEQARQDAIKQVQEEEAEKIRKAEERRKKAAEEAAERKRRKLEEERGNQLSLF